MLRLKYLVSRYCKVASSTVWVSSTSKDFQKAYEGQKVPKLNSRLLATLPNVHILYYFQAIIEKIFYDFILELVCTSVPTLSMQTLGVYKDGL